MREALVARSMQDDEDLPNARLDGLDAQWRRWRVLESPLGIRFVGTKGGVGGFDLNSRLSVVVGCGGVVRG